VTRAVVVVVVLVLLAACDRSPSARPAGGGDAAPVSYRISYRVTTGGTTATEVHTVRRPFLGRVDLDGATRVSDVGLLATASTGSSWLRMQIPVAPALGDVRPDVVLDDAIARGIARRHGERTVAGRRCRVVELGGPVTGGTLTPIGAVKGESAEACIAPDGLVLAESWRMQGKVQRDMTATKVDVGPVDDDAFDVPDGARVLSFKEGGGSVRPVTDDHDVPFAERWTIRVPAGFHHVGRYLVVPPALGAPVDPAAPRRAEVALVTDVWERGGDVLLLDQGATVGGAEPGDERPYARQVHLGAIGDGTLVLDLRLDEVRVPRPDGGFVRVAGTLAPDRLLDVATTLRQEDQ
jgi:hypothetical protein